MKTDNFYNKFSAIYPFVDIFLKPQKSKLFKEINKLPSGVLLEIGVGNGSHLLKYKKHKVIGIDSSLNMLEKAKQIELKNVELILMDGENLLFEEQKFDYVVLSHVIAVVENPEKLLQEIYSVLKPKGRVFILNHFTPTNWLRFIDYAFQPISKIFHFNGVFKIENIKTIEQFKLLQEINFGPLNYFKLLVYTKA